MYIAIHPFFHPNFTHNRIRLKYSQIEDIENVEDINHELIRECLKKVGTPKGIEIASFADIPAGTGLGSSSSFTVGLLQALYSWKGEVVSKERLASEACEIEIEVLRAPIGKQDQYAAAYGDLNMIKFNSDESVEVSPIILNDDTRNQMEKNLSLYYLGHSREANSILSQQNSSSNIDEKYKTLESMMPLVDDFASCLQSGQVEEIGKILNEGWMLKKSLVKSISNSSIDETYEKAIKFGARGGKLLGAGGTGFLLLDADDHEGLSKKLGLERIPFQFDREGSKVIYYE